MGNKGSNFAANASAEQCASVKTSYGSMLNVLSYLEPLEQTKLQALDPWMYSTGVKRSQTKFDLPVPKMIFTTKDTKLELFSMDQECYIKKLPISDALVAALNTHMRLVQIGKTGYLVGDDSCLSVSLCRDSTGLCQWKKLADLPTPQSGHSMCVQDGRFVWAIGDDNSEIGAEDCGKITRRYDTLTDKWEQMPDMNHTRKDAAVCFLDNKVFVFFGKGAGLTHSRKLALSERNDLEFYDTRQNPAEATWTLIQSSSVPKFGAPRMPSICELSSNQILIFGGEVINELTDTFTCKHSWVYNTNNNKMSRGTDLSLHYNPQFSTPVTFFDKTDLVTVGSADEDWNKVDAPIQVV